MVESLSQRRLKKRKLKTRLDALEAVRRTGGTGKIFSVFKNQPSAEQFVQMCLASRYGETETGESVDPLTAGGEAFANEYLCDEWNKELLSQQPMASGDVADLDWVREDESGPYNGVSTSQDESFGNLRFVLLADEILAPHLQPLRPEFLVALDESRYPGLYVEVDPEDPPGVLSWGVRFEVSILQDLNPEMHKPRTWSRSELKSNNHCSIYFVTVGTLDRLITDEEQELHGVKGHDRHLANGKIVMVRPHERKNPSTLRPRRSSARSFDHVVYRVLDADGELRYFGEGTTGRPDHVNSGCSHNIKINEHYFLRGPMKVEIIHRGLAKDEALAIERLLLRSHRHLELWNRKDFEPEPQP